MYKRTFIAIKILPNNNLKNIYLEIKSRFKEDRIKWVDIDSLHITLQFFGKTQQEEIKNISTILEKISSQFSAFELEIMNFGVFPSLKMPNVFWLGLENTKILINIQKEINTLLTLKGFNTEKRKFKPHLTIARTKFIKNTNKILSISEEIKGKIIQKTMVKEIIFYESVLNRNGAIYLPLKNYILTK